MKKMTALVVVFLCLCVSGIALAEDQKSEFSFRTIIGPFDKGCSEIDSRIREQLVDFVSSLPEKHSVIVIGYATATGSAEVNYKLSSGRAQKVVDHLLLIEPNISIANVFGNVYQKNSKDLQVNETIVKLLVFETMEENISSAALMEKETQANMVAGEEEVEVAEEEVVVEEEVAGEEVAGEEEEKFAKHETGYKSRNLRFAKSEEEQKRIVDWGYDKKDTSFLMASDINEQKALDERLKGYVTQGQIRGARIVGPSHNPYWSVPRSGAKHIGE